LTCTAVISSNILNSNQILSPNFTLGTFGGGVGSAGVMDLNSGRINNILRLEWYTSNISIGNSAIYNIGNNNICVGEGAGSGLTSGDNCIFIGGTQTVATTSNNQIVIGNGISRRANEFVCGSSSTTIVRPNADNTTDLGVRDGTGNQQFRNIYFSGNLYKNGALFTGGGGSVTGISSVDNGSNDIEISFTGTDYLNKQGQFLYFDNNTGRIQATTAYTPANTEYNNISTLFNNYYPSSSGYQAGDTWSIIQIYLKNNLAPGSWSNEAVYVLINKIRSGVTTRVIVDTVTNNWTWATMVETLVASGNITNANLIYSTQQPSKTTAQDISTRFKDNYEARNIGETITQITGIWLANDPNVIPWTPKDVFYIRYYWNNTNHREAEVSLYGSASGWVGNSVIPPSTVLPTPNYQIL
jgi:hypothetical protein